MQSLSVLWQIGKNGCNNNGECANHYPIDADVVYRHYRISNKSQLEPIPQCDKSGFEEMKKYLGRTKKGEYTQSDVRKVAMRVYWRNVQDMVRYCSCFPPQIFDHRFCFDNEVEREYWVIVRNRNYYADARMMQDKRKERMQNRKGCEFVGILQNPIVIDYLKHHRFHSHRLYADHISWGVRNHWAKSEKDERILQIFIKHEKNRKQNFEVD